MYQILYNIFEQYGVVGISIALLICLLIYLFKIQTKGLDNSINDMAVTMSNAITNQNNKLISSLQESQNKLLDNQMNMISYMMISNKQMHSNGLEQRQSMLNKISTTLKILCEESKCDRVSLIEFHNSKENLNGLPFLWYDIHAEYFKPGMTSISAKVKDLQAFNLLHVINRINDSEEHYCVYNKVDLDNLAEESPVLYYQLVEELHAETMIYIGLYGDDNLLVGLLSFEYKHDFNTDEFSDLKKRQCLQAAHNIEELLKFAPFK